MSCPKCGRKVEENAVICPGCDFIIDSSFLGDDITNAIEAEPAEPSVVVQNPLLSSAGYGQDDLILGDGGAGEFEAFESQNTGLAREVTHARIFVGGAASELLRPDAIPTKKDDVDPDSLNLTPFEVHILSLCNGYRPVGRIRRKSGMTDAEVHTSLAMLHDKSVIQLAGYVSEARKARARKRRRERKRRERAKKKGADAFDLDVAHPQKAPPKADAAAPAENVGGNAKRAPLHSVVERTQVSVLPSAAAADAAASDAANLDARLDANSDAIGDVAPDPAAGAFDPTPTGDVDLDALAAGAAADAAVNLAPDDNNADDAPGMSEQDLLLSMAEGAVSEVALESQSQSAADAFDLDALAQDASEVVSAENVAQPSADADAFPPDFLEPSDARDDDDSEESPASVDHSVPQAPEERVLAALADEFDGSESEPTGPADIALSSLDVGSIDIASVADAPIELNSMDVASMDVESSPVLIDTPQVGIDAAEVALQDAQDSSVPPPLPSSESVPLGFSIEEDSDLADALLDSEEGSAIDAPASVIRPAARVAPAMSARNKSARSTMASAVEESQPSAAPSSRPSSSVPGLPGAGAPPSGAVPPGLPGAVASGALDIQSAEDEGISLEGFSVEDSSEEEPLRPNVSPALAAEAKRAAMSGAPQQTVSFEMQRKARLIFEQAQKDMVEGRPSSALMNAKLACIYDPNEAEFKIALEAWQNQSMSNVARPKELMLFEEAKDSELDGEYEHAVSLLRQALDINPRAAPIYNRLGVILATRLKQYAPASQALLQACELDPGNLAYKNNLGKILVMEEKEVDSKRSKRGLADRLLGGKEDANIRVRTIRPKQF